MWNTELFSELDLYFAGFMKELSSDEKGGILLLSAALVSRSRRNGNVCLDIAALAGSTIEAGPFGEKEIRLPELDEWRKELLATKLVGTSHEWRPLILDEKNRLYLHRYWSYEQKLIGFFQARTQRQHAADIDSDRLKAALKKFFPDMIDSGIDWQMIAAAMAALKTFCVISGGPGTGKTYAAAKILAVILSQSSRRSQRILLCAPTGKAAARLAESINGVMSGLSCGEDIRQSIPQKGQTIHRCLKPRRGTPYFHYHAGNRIPADIIVVDEASMADLPLMSKLVEALRDETRLILMGDRHQLASVEAGSVLGDICGQKRRNGFSKSLARHLQELTGYPPNSIAQTIEYTTGIQDSIIFFTKQYRFEADSGIHNLSQAVNAGDGDAVIGILSDNGYADITWLDAFKYEAHKGFILRKVVERYQDLFLSPDPEDMLACMERFRILCAVNHGRWGVRSFNHLAQTVLSDEGFIRVYYPLPGSWYRGKPIIITENEYDIELFNGDVGVIFQPKSSDYVYKACFKSNDGDLRQYSAHRLPAYDTVYAMTIHKSQGSEFDEVLLVLPTAESPILTRELLYTGVTRARQKLSILASESAIRSAVSHTIGRTSGLRDGLWC